MWGIGVLADVSAGKQPRYLYVLERSVVDRGRTMFASMWWQALRIKVIGFHPPPHGANSPAPQRPLLISHTFGLSFDFSRVPPL